MVTRFVDTKVYVVVHREYTQIEHKDSPNVYIETPLKDLNAKPLKAFVVYTSTAVV